MLDGEKPDLWEEVPDEPISKPKKIKRKVKPRIKEPETKPEVKTEVQEEKVVKTEEKVKVEPKEVENRGISRMEVEIPQELIDKKAFTRKEFEETLKINTRKANRFLNKLIKEDKIKRIGSANSPSCYYEIITYE